MNSKVFYKYAMILHNLFHSHDLCHQEEIFHHQVAGKDEMCFSCYGVIRPPIHTLQQYQSQR